MGMVFKVGLCVGAVVVVDVGVVVDTGLVIDAGEVLGTSFVVGIGLTDGAVVGFEEGEIFETGLVAKVGGLVAVDVESVEAGLVVEIDMVVVVGEEGEVVEAGLVVKVGVIVAVDMEGVEVGMVVAADEEGEGVEAGLVAKVGVIIAADVAGVVGFESFGESFWSLLVSAKSSDEGTVAFEQSVGVIKGDATNVSRGAAAAECPMSPVAVLMGAVRLDCGRRHSLAVINTGFNATSLLSVFNSERTWPLRVTSMSEEGNDVGGLVESWLEGGRGHERAELSGTR
jgi:hypothetical protein